MSLWWSLLFHSSSNHSLINFIDVITALNPLSLTSPSSTPPFTWYLWCRHPVAKLTTPSTARKTCSTAASWHALAAKKALLKLHSKQAWMHSGCAWCTVTLHQGWNLSKTQVFWMSTGSSWASLPRNVLSQTICQKKMAKFPNFWPRCKY
jgi:hypothetical protein